MQLLTLMRGCLAPRELIDTRFHFCKKKLSFLKKKLNMFLCTRRQKLSYRKPFSYVLQNRDTWDYISSLPTPTGKRRDYMYVLLFNTIYEISAIKSLVQQIYDLQIYRSRYSYLRANYVAFIYICFNKF